MLRDIKISLLVKQLTDILPSSADILLMIQNLNFNQPAHRLNLYQYSKGFCCTKTPKLLHEHKE